MAPAARGGARPARRVAKRTAPAGPRTPARPRLSLGRRLSSTEEVRAVHAGVPVALARQIQREAGLTQEALANALGIPRRTLISHMKQQRFGLDESDRVLRLKRILEQADATFDADKEAARAWLKAPNRALGGSAPIDLVATGTGARAVEQVLGRMEHTLYS